MLLGRQLKPGPLLRPWKPREMQLLQLTRQLKLLLCNSSTRRGRLLQMLLPVKHSNRYTLLLWAHATAQHAWQQVHTTGLGLGDMFALFGASFGTSRVACLCQMSCGVGRVIHNRFCFMSTATKASVEPNLEVFVRNSPQKHSAQGLHSACKVPADLHLSRVPHKVLA